MIWPIGVTMSKLLETSDLALHCLQLLETSDPALHCLQLLEITDPALHCLQWNYESVFPHETVR